MPPRYPVADLDEWRRLAADKKAPTEVTLRKAAAGVIERAEGDTPIRIRLSTTQRDRQRDTVSASGWKLENFRANPVVLFAHSYYDLPIGRDVGLSIDERGLIGTPKFCAEDENPMGPRVERLIRGGYLNAASVGFQPETWQYNEEERGVDFITQDLLEYSVVPVPANPGALVEARSHGIDVGFMREWAEKVLDESPDSGLLIPRAALEAARKEAGGGKVVFFAMKGNTPVAVALESPESKQAAAPPAEKKEDEAPATETPVVETPTETPPPPDDDAIEIVDETSAGAGDDELVEIDAEEARAAIAAALKETLGPRLTALTGRLD